MLAKKKKSYEMLVYARTNKKQNKNETKWCKKKNDFLIAYQPSLGTSCGIMANVLDKNITVNEFELQSHNYIHFRKGMDLSSIIRYGLNSATTFYKNY